jgi:hypothetical protein
MANFNIGIDCPSEDSAEKLREFIESLDFFQDELDADEERVSVLGVNIGVYQSQSITPSQKFEP